MKLHDCVNFQLSQAQNAVFSYYKCRLAQYDVTPSQYAVLSCLWENDCQSPTQLAQILGLDTSSITGLLTRTESKGLIQRQFSIEDRRAVIIHITDRGMALKEAITQTIDDSNQVMMEGITKEESEVLRKCLAQLMQNAQKQA